MSINSKILVVEDDALIGADICSSLASFGYLVVGPLLSGEEAIEEISRGDIDFVLMDIGLSGELDGIETAEKIQDIRPTPVVFLSALNDETTLQRAKLVNPFGYLIKPFDGAELRATIELTLQRFAREISDITKVDTAKEIDQLPVNFADSGSSSERIDSYLSQLNVFKEISATSLRQLSQASSIRQCEGGEFLALEGDDPEGVFITISGRVSITKTAESGKELIVTLLAPGDAFGLVNTLPALKRSTSARVQVASKVIWIPVPAWQRFCAESPRIYQNLANILAECLSAAHTLSSSLAHERVEGRIVNTLIALMPGFGKSTDKNSSATRIFITRKELSELTGTTPETAIRVTKNLERAGLLDLTRPGIIKILDLPALRATVIS